MPLWASETATQRAALPAEVIDVLDRHEAAGTWDDIEYQQAVNVFYDRHLCRVVPPPEPDQRSFAKLDRNPQVYRTMNGPTEFTIVGTLADWEILSRLDAIDGPLLLTSGRHDEATPAQVERIADRLPQAEWVLFEQSGHLAHAEEPDRYMAAVADFLARAECGRVGTRSTATRAVGEGRLALRSAGAGSLTGRPGPARSVPPFGERP